MTDATLTRMEATRPSVWMLFRMHGLWWPQAVALLFATYVIAIGLVEWIKLDEDDAESVVKGTAQFVIAWYMGDFESD